MNSRRKLTTAVFAAVLAGACVSPASASALAGQTTCTGINDTAATATTAALTESTRCLIVAERAAAGLNQTAPSSQMTSVASRQVSDVISTGVLGHIGADGSNIVERVRRTGFLRRFKQYSVGEILAYGQASASTPAVIVNAWLNSATHARVIFFARFRQDGLQAQQVAPPSRGSSLNL